METLDARAILEDPLYEVPEAPPATEGMGWVRATVSRFANGEVHTRRRSLVEAELERLPPDELRAAARILATDFEPRDVPLATLCLALGVERDVLPKTVADARLVAEAYPLGSESGAAADAAADRLVALLGPARDEATAARVALLAQAGVATGTLAEGALALLRTDPIRSVEKALADVLRLDPPVKATRRVADGDTIVVDLATAQLPFGDGPRSCPGRAQALALAAGVLDTQP